MKTHERKGTGHLALSLLLTSALAGCTAYGPPHDPNNPPGYVSQPGYYSEPIYTGPSFIFGHSFDGGRHDHDHRPSGDRNSDHRGPDRGGDHHSGRDVGHDGGRGSGEHDRGHGGHR